MNIDQFDFNLPEGLIAQQPVSPRHNSKLLSCINSELNDLHFYDLPNLLNPGDVIVVNDTKVLKAKLIGFINEYKINGRNIKFNIPGTIAAINQAPQDMLILKVFAIFTINGFAAIAVRVIALVIIVAWKQT